MGISPREEDVEDFFLPPPLLANAMTTTPSMVAEMRDFFSMWLSLSVKIIFINLDVKIPVF